MGSNKLLHVALGKTDADEYRLNLHEVSTRLTGQVGLFFTSMPREEVGFTQPLQMADARHLRQGRSGLEPYTLIRPDAK